MDVTVYITSYNQQDLLIEAMESVLAQTRPASQIIIVDDCSTDGSRVLIERYAARYRQIATIFHETNMGIGCSRRDALRAVTGDVVTYVDGDDRLLPTKLEREIGRMTQTGSPIVFSNYFYIDQHGKRMGQWCDRTHPPQGDVFLETFGRAFPRKTLFRHELVSYAAWKRVGFHDPRLRVYEDFEMRLRLTKVFPVEYLDEPLSEYRVHSASLRSTNAESKLSAYDMIVAKNRHLLDDLQPNQVEWVWQKINEWRAYLLRQAAKDSLVSPAGRNRKHALGLFIKAWKIHRTADWDFLARLILGRTTYLALRNALFQSRRIL